MTDIRTLEAYTLRAWPALENRYYDGWVLRFSGGYTRRANSVNPVFGSSLDIDEKITFCESLYGDSIYYKMTEAVFPYDLDATLEERGYSKIGNTLVKLRTLHDFPNLEHFPDNLQIECSGKMTESWFKTFITYGGIETRYVPVMRHMIELVTGKKGLFLLKQGETPVAVGLGVVDDEYASLFDIVTVPEYRRKGYGELLVRSILEWGKSNGGKHVFLQVVADNAPAQALYEKLGFHTAYRYWYRHKPVASDV